MSLVKLQEHIDILRKLKIPYKKQLITLVADVIIQHYSINLDALVDTDITETMTLKQFIDQIMTTPKEAKP